MSFNFDSKEMEYIRFCLERELSPDLPFTEPALMLDWERLFDLLHVNGLSAHFYAIGKKYTDKWPISFRDRLRAEHYIYLLYGEKCSFDVKSVLGALHLEGINVIVLKGWAIIQTIYHGDFSQRFCRDIDLLVHPRDVDTVEKILGEEGWRGEQEKYPGYDRRYWNARAYFRSKQLFFTGNGFGVGLHWNLIHNSTYNLKPSDIDVLFTNTSSLTVEGIPVLQLSLEDQVVYNCAHIINHHGSEDLLFRYYEVAATIAKASPEISWVIVMERATQWKMVLPVQHVLLSIGEMWPGIIRPSALDDMARLKPCFKERLIFFFSNQLSKNPGHDFILTLFTLDGIIKKVEFIFENIFPGYDYMQVFFGPLPGKRWLLLYIKRFRQVFQYFIR